MKPIIYFTGVPAVLTAALHMSCRYAAWKCRKEKHDRTVRAG